MADVLVDDLEPETVSVPAPKGGRSHRRGSSRLVRYLFRFIAIAYVFLLVAWPVSLVAKNTFADGWSSMRTALDDPLVTSALKLSIKVAIIAVIINLVFGVGMSLILVRRRFPGRRALSALIDLPLSVSPVVVGLALVLTYNGRDGWFGTTLEAHGHKILFATPAIVMATV
ncbi:MAG: sulfate transporter permease subunit, partial [Ilumatobacteraceae bacterium]|nr:sulfate transporter permease subunit [Ilumatobacteraceae bacterium]